MIYLLFALLAGYAIGKIKQTGRSAYAICVPVSVLVYALTNAMFFSMHTDGEEFEGLAMIIIVGVMQAPLLMLGVFLARRSTKRNNFEA